MRFFFFFVREFLDVSKLGIVSLMLRVFVVNDEFFSFFVSVDVLYK